MTMASCRGFRLGWAVLAGLSAWGQPSNGLVTIPHGDNWFDHPEILCGALQTLGYHAGSWGQIRGSPVHICVYPPVVRTSDTPAAIDAMLATAQPPAPLSLALEVSGLSPRQADSLRIAITIPTPEARPKAKEQMLSCIDSLYRVIGQQVPAALPAYVQREQHYLSHQRYGTVSFFMTARPKAQVFWFYLTKNP
ncbi:MAG TPA: hypothetical protein VMH81_31890 [Bryobacteraceae bacterium]|nr:hypothetical protein [Bryobacteraceae bacterium]